MYVCGPNLKRLLTIKCFVNKTVMLCNTLNVCVWKLLFFSLARNQREDSVLCYGLWSLSPDLTILTSSKYVSKQPVLFHLSVRSPSTPQCFERTYLAQKTHRAELGIAPHSWNFISLKTATCRKMKLKKPCWAKTLGVPLYDITYLSHQ